jgi:phage FluMu protein Com
MLPTITTTHAIPQRLPTGSGCSEVTTVRCSYCLEVLGEAENLQQKIQMHKTHRCKEKRLMKKPAASVPFN